MKIALTNDDGYDAAGIQTLINIFSKEGHEVLLIAPKNHESGASNSLSLGKRYDVAYYKDTRCFGFLISAHPADCVRTGLILAKQTYKFVPDIVISGINCGGNLGRDLHYSGTFGAAREAFMQGFPCAALSNNNLDESAENMEQRVGWFIKMVPEMVVKNGRRSILNINFPIGEPQKVIECHPDTISRYDIGMEIKETESGFSVLFDGLTETNGQAKGCDIDQIIMGNITISRVLCWLATASDVNEVKKMQQ